jgi:hypothetical protein
MIDLLILSVLLTLVLLGSWGARPRPGRPAGAGVQGALRRTAPGTNVNCQSL